jgi:hypothetical protein
MLKILGGLFAARQRGVEDGAAPPTGIGLINQADACQFYTFDVQSLGEGV